VSRQNDSLDFKNDFSFLTRCLPAGRQVSKPVAKKTPSQKSCEGEKISFAKYKFIQS
jgi:hypothetical protein